MADGDARKIEFVNVSKKLRTVVPSQFLFEPGRIIEQIYLTNSRIALSSPAKVSGYIRSLIIWRTIRIE